MKRSLRFKLRNGEAIYRFPGDFLSEQEARQFLCAEYGVKPKDVITVGSGPERFLYTRAAPEVPLLQTAYSEDAGYDLSAWLPEDKELTLKSHEEYPVPTGYRVEIPLGWAGLILPRSSLRRKWGLTVSNSPGLIDPGYRGDLMVLIYNSSMRPRTIQHGDRIAQLLLTPVYPYWPVEVANLSETERGGKGFGSSGSSTHNEQEPQQ